MRKYCHDHIGELTGYSKGWCALCRAERLLAVGQARIAELEAENERLRALLALSNTCARCDGLLVPNDDIVPHCEDYLLDDESEERWLAKRAALAKPDKPKA